MQSRSVLAAGLWLGECTNFIVVLEFDFRFVALIVSLKLATVYLRCHFNAATVDRFVVY